MKKLFTLIVVAFISFSVVCYAGKIYSNSLNEGIELFKKGQFYSALQQFIALQNIAPVDNDLATWISKCYNNMVRRRNEGIRANVSSLRNSPNQNVGRKIQQYDSIGYFGSSNLALVRENHKFGFINRDSIIVVPLIYDDVYAAITEKVPKYFKNQENKWSWVWDSGQLMSVSKDEKWGYINEKGNEVIPIVYDDVREPHVIRDRKLIGVGKNGKYGFVDWAGKEVIPLEYDLVSRFYNGLHDSEDYDMAAVVKYGKMGFINDKGNILIPFDYEPKYSMEYSRLIMERPVWFEGTTVLKKDGKFGVVDLKGNTLTGFKFDDAGDVSVVNINGLYPAYYILPWGEKQIFFFDGKEYESEQLFNEEITKRIMQSKDNNSSSLKIRIIDPASQEKDPDYSKLKHFKEEIAKLSSSTPIKKFNYFSEGIAVIELSDGMSLLFFDKESMNYQGVSITWPYFHSSLLGCCYNYTRSSSWLDGFYLNGKGEYAIKQINLGNEKYTVIGSRYGKKICAGPFMNNYAEAWHFKGDNPKYGMINSDGYLVVPCKYDYVRHIGNGFIAEKGNDVVFLNENAYEIDKIKNANIKKVSEKEFIIYVDGEGYRRYSESLICLEKSKNYLYLPNEYDLHAESTYRGSVKYGYCDNSGQIIIPYQYQKAKEFSDGLACVCINDKYGYINTNGDIVINPIFDDAGSFNEGIAWVKNGDVYYYINTKGKLINDGKYSYADDFHEGFGIVRINNQYGIVSKSGLSTFDIW
ncbi:MAG: WG repeat-containing protein [Muribaculaceae bacterium]|nr:WG repeat-containing protein [Muribaculaceae bacterium]